jgi:hypothetical protein
MTKDTKKTLRSIIIACVAIFALSSVAFALPPEKTGAQLPTLTRQSQFEELKGGDKVELVCKVCDTVKVIDIRDAKEVMALCNEAGWFIVPSARRNTRSLGLPRQIRWTADPKLAIVNEKVEPCMFFAKLR